MPFDSIGYLPPVKVASPSQFFRASKRQRLEMLADALEHQQWWEDRMAWVFSMTLNQESCGFSGCAMGLCQILWPGTFPDILHADAYRMYEIAEHLFGIDYYASLRLFSGEGYTDETHEVEPGDVAQNIRSHLLETA